MAAKKDDFTVKKISPKLGGERGSRNPNGPTSSHDLVEQMEFLYVEIKAVNKTIVNPIVEITLGNYKSSTKTLPIGPKGEWNQVIFAFDKSKGDFLSVTLWENGTVTGRQNFKVATDIPFRVPPDARIAPQWYSMNTQTGRRHVTSLLMSVWSGTQADEVYPQAWFSDASEVSASCVINTRPKLYLAPRLCYVRVTIVSGHDLILNDVNRTPSVYVKVILGKFELKTEVSLGSNPSWNQDLIFVASEPLEETIYITLFDRVTDIHHKCIGTLKKKLSEITALKVPGSAPALFYDIEPPVEVEPAGDSRRFASRIKMKLATDQTYHVFDECIQHSSDYRAFAKGLWPDLLGKLEIGILSATGLQPMKDWRGVRRSTNAYVVAKYGNKWARTRTVVGSFSPKWNEQYSWDVYDKCTTVTLGIFNNSQLVFPSNNQMNDGLIGKIRIKLTLLEWDRLYTCSCPILVLREDGLKKMGEIQLAIRCVCVAKPYVRLTSPFRWMLPKAHYKSPLSIVQTEELRSQAVMLNCLNLAKTEPPLRNEVVMEMLRPRTNRNFSMRVTNFNWERLLRVAESLFGWVVRMNGTIRTTTDFCPKIVACVASVVVVFGWWYWILCLAVWPVIPVYLAVISLWEIFRYLRGLVVLGVDNRPPLIPIDLKHLDLDELDEEFDTFPSSVTDVDVLRMRYDRLRKMGENVMLFLGDVASQCERVFALSALLDSPFVWICFVIVCYLILVLVYLFWGHVFLLLKFLFIYFVVCWVNFQCFRNDLPSGISNFFRRLPTKEDSMF